MSRPTLLHDHCHNGVIVSSSPLLVFADNLIYADVANQVTIDEDEVASNDAVRVYVAHRIPWGKRLLGYQDGHDL